MEKRSLIWIGGTIGVATIVGAAFLWQAKSQKAMAPVVETETALRADANAVKNPTVEDPSGILVEENRSLTLDEISTGIKGDLSEDETAFEDENTAEIGSVDSSHSVVTELGNSYDESNY
ncbi:MAG: hypothetical protein ABI747_01555 [Candidatus Moraniibacteriota bacterium]